MPSYRSTQLNSGMRCAKYMLLIVSFMFAITAILLVMVGTTIQSIFGDFRIFIDDHFMSPPALMIATGFLMLFVSTLGAYGAIKESVLLINMYGVCLFIVFILEAAAAIAAFALQSQVSAMLVRTMDLSLSSYESNEYVQVSVDFMQETFECCGVNSPADWKPYWSPNANLTTEQLEANEIIVPESCCGHYSTDMPNYCDYQFDSGCLTRMIFVISQSTMLIATGATTVAFVQLLGVFCAFTLAKTLRRNKSLREARRWQLQQTLGELMSGGKVAPPVNSPLTGYTQLERNEGVEHEPVAYTATSPSVN